MIERIDLQRNESNVDRCGNLGEILKRRCLNGDTLTLGNVQVVVDADVAVFTEAFSVAVSLPDGNEVNVRVLPEPAADP